MEKIGLVWSIQSPKDLLVRAELIPYRVKGGVVENDVSKINDTPRGG
jgi:hypothetical protein